MTPPGRGIRKGSVASGAEAVVSAAATLETVVAIYRLEMLAPF